MKIIDARSGKEIKIGETIVYSDEEYVKLLDVVSGIFKANALVQRKYPLKYKTGIHTDVGFAENQIWIPLVVRFIHPKYFLQHVAFIPS